MPEKKYSPNVLIDNKNTKEPFGPSYTGWVPINKGGITMTRILLFSSPLIRGGFRLQYRNCKLATCVVLVPSYTGWVPIKNFQQIEIKCLTVLVPSYTGWVPIESW